MTAEEETPDEPDEAAVEESPAATPSPVLLAVGRAGSWALSNVRPIALLTLVIASAAITAGVYVWLARPDRDIDHAAADRVVQAASEGAVAALSYSSDSLDRDIATAKLHLTGDFLEYYNKFTRDVVVPTVREKHLTQQATIVRAAVSQLQPDSAVVLAYVNETTKSPARKDQLTTPSAIRMTLQKVDGAWLISKLDPVA